MLKVHRVTIHEIIKKPKETKADKFYAEKLIPIGDYLSNAYKLIEKANKAYEDDEIVYSSFAKTTLSTFPEKYQAYTSTSSDDSTFINFSTATLEELRIKLAMLPMAKGGYYVYSEYSFNEEEFLGIFLIRDTEGLLFKKSKDKKGFDVDTITYMNLEKLAMACRISKTRYSAKKTNYLTLIKKNQEVISDYFYEWISTANKESSREYTDSLYEMISQIKPPIIEGVTYTLDQVRKNVLANIVESGREVNLRELGKKIYNDREILVKYAKQKGIAIDTSFKAEKKSLNKFRHVNVNADGIKFQFNHGDYEKQKIRFSPEDENIVIIESEKFAAALRRELTEYKINAIG